MLINVENVEAAMAKIPDRHSAKADAVYAFWRLIFFWRQHGHQWPKATELPEALGCRGIAFTQERVVRHLTEAGIIEFDTTGKVRIVNVAQYFRDERPMLVAETVLEPKVAEPSSPAEQANVA